MVLFEWLGFGDGSEGYDVPSDVDDLISDDEALEDIEMDED